MGASTPGVILCFFFVLVVFSSRSAAEESNAQSTLSGELGMVVGMKFDHDNRIMGGHYTEYVVTNRNDVVPIEATPNVRKIPLHSVVHLRGKMNQSSSHNQKRYIGELKSFTPPRSISKRGWQIPERQTALGEMNVIFFAVNLPGYTWPSDPANLQTVFENLRQNTLRASYGQLNLVSRKRDNSFGYYGIVNVAPSGPMFTTAGGPPTIAVHYDMANTCKARLADDAWWDGVPFGGRVIRVILWVSSFTGYGLGTVGHPGNAWSAVDDRVLTHETGHVLGMLHAGLPSGAETEYGDRSDFMGIGTLNFNLASGGNHPNAAHKVHMGWMRDQPQRLRSLTDTGSYSIRLTNLALADNLGNPQAVSLGDSSAYTASFPGLGSHFIGYRLNTPSGRDFFDPVYEGVNIHSQISDNGRSFFLGTLSSPGQELVVEGPEMSARIRLNGRDGTFADIQVQYVRKTSIAPSGGVHAVTAPLQFFAVSPPYRLIDTRLPNQGPKLLGGETRTYNLYNTPGVPTTAVSLSGSICVTEQEAGGFLTMWPASAPMPEASVLNYQTGIWIVGSVYSTVSLSGEFRVFTMGTTHIILDISGYFAPAAPSGLWFNPVAPFRVFDTRQRAVMVSGEEPFPFRGVGAIPADAVAVSYTLGMVEQHEPGFVTVWADGPRTETSVGLFTPGITGEAAGIAAIGGDGAIRFFPFKPLHLIADVDGFFTTAAKSESLGFVPTASPSRFLDSRKTAYHGNGNYNLKIGGVSGPGGVTVPAGAKAVVCTATAVSIGLPGFVTIWPAGAPMPVAAVLQLNTKMAVMALALNLPLGTDGAISIFMSTGGDIIVDVVGYYLPTQAVLGFDANLIGLYALFPTVLAEQYLGGVDAVVPFAAVAGPRYISAVEFRMNGQRLGDAVRCNLNQWCFSVNFRDVNGPTTITAVPDSGDSVSYKVPVLKPSWLSPYLSKLQVISPAQFSGSFTMPWISQSGSSAFDIPLLSFEHSWKASATATVIVDSALGSLRVTGDGSRSDSFKSTAATHVGSAAAVQVLFDAAVAKEAGGDKTFVPVINSARVNIRENVPLLSLWDFSTTISFFGFQFGVQVDVDAHASTDMTILYSKSAADSLFGGLPLAQQSVSGDVLKIDAAIAGRVNAGALPTAFSANLTLHPAVTWSQAKGLEWQGIDTSSNMGVYLDLWHYRVGLVLANTNRRVLPRKRTAVDQTTSEPLRNVWSPHVITSAPSFVLADVYPSASACVASGKAIDVLAWSSFDPSTNLLQVQFSWRSATQENAVWSSPQFAAATSTHLGMPVLEDLESTGDIILVASEVLDASLPLSQLNSRLVFSRFLTDTKTWTPFAPICTGVTTNAAEWLPTFSESGLWMSFIRYDHAAHKGRLMATQYHPSSGWSEAKVVVEDSAEIFSFSMDSDENDNAMLVYQSSKFSALQLCLYQKQEAASWKCVDSKYASSITSKNSAPSLLFTSDAYLLFWSVGDTIQLRKLSKENSSVEYGNFSFKLPHNVGGLVVAVSNLTGEGTALLGWSEWTANGSALFHYAIVDSTGKLLYTNETATSVLYEEVASDAAVSPKGVFSTAANLAWTGDELLFVTIYRPAESTSAATAASGTLVARSLPIDAIARLDHPAFSPADFSDAKMTISITLENWGLKPLEANGQVVFTLVSGSGSEQEIATYQHTQPLHYSERLPISVSWDMSEEKYQQGGIIEVFYFGSDGKVAEEVLRFEPCVYGLSRAVITSLPNATSFESAIAINFDVYGPAVVPVRFEAWTTLEDKTRLLLGSLSYVTKPHQHEQLFIPVSNISAIYDDLTVRVIGLRQKGALMTTAYDERFDFAINAAEILVQPGEVIVNDDGSKSGRFQVKFPVHNYGTHSAVVSLIVQHSDAGAGSTPLHTTEVIVNGISSAEVNTSFLLTEYNNDILFVVNSDSQPLPELNTNNNRARMSLIFTEGRKLVEATPSATIVTSESTATPTVLPSDTPLPPSSSEQKNVATTHRGGFSSKLSTIAIAAGVIVGVLLIAAVVLVVTLAVLRRLRTGRVRCNTDKEFLTTQYTLA